MKTIQELEAMSDFEINIIMAHYDPAIINDTQPPQIQNESAVYMNDIVSQWTMDWCNNWSDMGPLIEWIFNENVTFAINGGGIITSSLGVKFNGAKLNIECKPLRAAAIVYILIKQANLK